MARLPPTPAFSISIGDPLKEELHGKVLVPVLHDHYGAVLESGELKLVFRAEQGEFDICYQNSPLPGEPQRVSREFCKALPTNWRREFG